MTTLEPVARWTAIAIAVAAVIDPAVQLPRRARPAVRVVGNQDGRLRPAAFADGYGAQVMADVTRQLRDAGFALDEPQNEAATVLVADAPDIEHLARSTERAARSTEHPAPSTEHPASSTEHPASSTEHPALSTQHRALSTPVWALDTSPLPPNVRIAAASGPATRLPGQAVEVRVTLEARGLAGKTSDILLEDAGIVVASARHDWKTDKERWRGSLQYLPPGAAGGRLRVKAGESAADVAVPPVRGPLRTLVVEAGVTWPAVFVRRAIEGESAFAVAALERASKRIATRAGAPPAALTREALERFEVALIGAPDSLTTGDVEALRWFVEERGGVAVLIPDQRPIGRYVDLLGGAVLDARGAEAPVRLSQGLQASEWLVSRQAPAGSRTLAATESNEAVVFSARRGAGAVIFSGALDAWRYRAQHEDAFARFWRRAIADEATAVPPVLEVSVDPSVIATGSPARVRARVRATELAAGVEAIDLDAVRARAVSPTARVDVAVRLWPTAEPGVYEGEWQPSLPGDYNIAVTAGARRGDAPVTVASTVSQASAADPEGLALIARTSGGRVFPANQSAALVDGMKKAFPARIVTATVNPMRSSWWVVPFAGLLCAEWALRRRRGLP